MMWSEKELANIAIMNADVVVNRVLKHIDDPDNIDIFRKENFSYLWGILGVAGVKGVSKRGIDKIWTALKENGVLDAFDKGVLGDFNKELIKKYKDNRLRSWCRYDNFTADQRFKKMILMPVVAVNREYAQQVDTQAFNPIRVLRVLERYPLSEPVKQMLIDMQGHGAACGISGKEVVEHYEKEKVLAKLCNIIAHNKRKLNEDEKDFLFRYIHDAIIDGFEYEAIGLNDFVFANLMTDETDENLSELELAPIHERNIEIVEFAKKFDSKYGFFELTASKLIKNSHLNIPGMIERCLSLINKTDPKGVVFALELVNLKQLRSAARILIALARKGRATELASFLHRVLPNANGAEVMIMSILKLNLKMLKEKEILNTNQFFREYPARIYILGVKQFIEYGFYKEATALLSEITDNGWVNGFDDLEKECIVIVNYLFSKDRSLEDGLRAIAKGLHLNVYGEGEEIYFGERGDNPISNARKNAEKILSDVTGIDVSSKLDKLAIVEGVAYETYQTIKNVFHKNKEEHDENSPTFDAVNYGNDVLEKTDKLLVDKDENGDVAEISNVSEENSSQICNDDSAKEVDIVSENNEDNKNSTEDDVAVEVKSEKAEIEEWTSENETQNISAVNYENILKIDEQEVDKHFEEIEKNTSEILKRVEQKAREIKISVENKCSETSEVVGKLKKFTDKLMTFKKK